MTYEQYKEKMEKEFSKRLQEMMDDINVTFSKFPRGNRMIDGINIRQKGMDHGVIINLNELYPIILHSCDSDQVISNVISQVMDHLSQDKYVSEMRNTMNNDKKNIKIMIQLVNRAKSQELLSYVPHRPFLDLEITYRMIGKITDKGMTSCIINEELMDRYGWTEEDLYQIAMDQHVMKTETFLLTDLMIPPIYRQNAYEPDPMSPYVLTNEHKFYGANEILYSENLQKISDRYQSDLYILPSSIHECIIASVNDISVNEAQELVRDTNSSAVPEEFQLSNNVYLYERKSGRIKITEDSRLSKEVNHRKGMSMIMECGMIATIIDYRSHNDIDILFEDGTIVKHRSFYNFAQGKIVNPNM